MSQSCNDKIPEIIDDKIGTELRMSLEEIGVDPEQMMSYYHRLDQDDNDLKELAHNIVNDDVVKQTENAIVNLENQIQTYRKLRQGRVQDLVEEMD